MDYQIGTCLHIEGHYQFIIAAVLIEPERYLVVPVCTRNKPNPHDCVIQAGSYSFVNHESYIRYSDHVVLTRSTIGSFINTGTAYFLQDILIEDDLTRIKDDLTRTNQLSRAEINDLQDDFVIL